MPGDKTYNKFLIAFGVYVLLFWMAAVVFVVKFLAVLPKPVVVPSDLPATTEIPSISPSTSNWLTYQDEDFTLKYPQDFKVSQSSDLTDEEQSKADLISYKGDTLRKNGLGPPEFVKIVQFAYQDPDLSTPDIQYIQVVIYQNPQRLNAYEWVVNYEMYPFNFSQTTDVEQIKDQKVGQFTGKSYKGIAMAYERGTFLPVEDKMFMFFEYMTRSDYDTGIAIFDQILSTFSLPSTENTSTKTYTLQDGYSFSFDVLKDYIAKDSKIVSFGCSHPSVDVLHSQEKYESNWLLGISTAYPDGEGSSITSEIPIDGVPFYLFSFGMNNDNNNIGCDQYYEPKALYDGSISKDVTHKLYFKLVTHCQNEPENPDLAINKAVYQQIVKSIKFSPEFKEYLLGNNPNPPLRHCE